MKDLKYLAALSIPITAIIGLTLKNYWVYLTPVYSFVLIPLLELLLPQDNTNCSKDDVENKILNRLFDWMLYLNLPIVYGVLIFGLFTIASGPLSDFEIVGLTLSVGMVLGSNGINVGHELGHRQQSNERFIGKALLLPSLYMHFYISHNRGHLFLCCKSKLYSFSPYIIKITIRAILIAGESFPV